MKRRIDLTVGDDGARVLDYTVILNEKQNQIIELEKKINNLEDRLRKASARELELENHVTYLYGELKRKDELIQSRNEIILAEVAATNGYRDTLSRLRRNLDMNRSKIGDLEKILLDGVQFPEAGSFEIKADLLMKDGAASRTSAYQSQSSPQKYKTQLIQLFRQLERLAASEAGLNDTDIEKAFEGFLLNLNGTRLRESVAQAIARNKLDSDYRRLREQFGVAVGIFQHALAQISVEHPSLKIGLDPYIF